MSSLYEVAHTFRLALESEDEAAIEAAGTDLTDYLDHIIPLALGGLNEDLNIQLLRPICNRQKHAKHPIDFMKSKGFLL